MAKTKYPYTPDANVEKEEYVVTWESVPGPETERLLYYLEQDLFVDWSYLFTLETSFAGQLDQQQLPPSLRRRFADHGIRLSVGAAVRVDRAHRRWSVLDGDDRYAIRADGTALVVNDTTATPQVTKSPDGMAIHVTKGANPVVEITRADDASAVHVHAGKGRDYDLVLKVEDGLHKVFAEANWVDTWYEFTPTGALDVVEGTVTA